MENTQLGVQSTVGTQWLVNILTGGYLLYNGVFVSALQEHGKVAQSCPTLCDPMDCSPPGSSVGGGPPGENTGVGCPDFLQGIFPNPGIKPRSPALQADYLPTEPPGKPKNTGAGSLSHLQGIFPTQEPNPGLLWCRWILHQMSYLGSVRIIQEAPSEACLQPTQVVTKDGAEFPMLYIQQFSKSYLKRGCVYMWVLPSIHLTLLPLICP